MATPAVKARYQEISPLHQVSGKSPPTLFFLGTKDPLVPVATAREFESRMKKSGVRCEVKLIEGGAHPVYAYQDGPSHSARRNAKGLRGLPALGRRVPGAVNLFRQVLRELYMKGHDLSSDSRYWC